MSSLIVSTPKRRMSAVSTSSSGILIMLIMRVMFLLLSGI